MNTQEMILLFQCPESGERAHMLTSDLVECGTPISDESSRDMEYVGMTDSYCFAMDWVNRSL